MHADAQPQHQWLQHLVGTWTFTLESGHGITPGEPSGSGTEVVRSVGDLWVVAEGQATMPGMGLYSTASMLGFNPATGRFVGTYIASFMTHLWVYDGALDEAGRTLTLGSEGPSMADDGTTQYYEDAIKLVSNDERLFSARVQKADGTWQHLMTMRYLRER